MSLRRGFVDAVGNTPLIRLAGLSEETGCEILGKAEFMNPGRFGEGPRREVDRARRRGARRAAGRAARSSKARPAIPASASRTSAMPAAIAA